MACGAIGVVVCRRPSYVGCRCSSWPDGNHPGQVASCVPGIPGHVAKLVSGPLFHDVNKKDLTNQITVAETEEKNAQEDYETAMVDKATKIHPIPSD